VPHVVAENSKPANAQLTRLDQQRPFIKGFVCAGLRNRLSRAGDESQMGEPDLAGSQALMAFVKALQVLTHGDPVGRCASAEVEPVPDPVDRRDGSLLVVLVGGGESRRHLRELEIDHVAAALQLSHVRPKLRTVRARRSRAEACDQTD
jgi:hypothetical protein